MPIRNIVRQIMERHTRANFSDTDEVINRLEQENAKLRAEIREHEKPKQKMGGCAAFWTKETEL